MLIIKPNCELCDCDLPANSSDARICSYECTFCQRCVSDVLHNVCPNCGGGFSARPMRPATAHRKGVSLHHHPASRERIHSNYSRAQIEEFVTALQTVKPECR